MKKIEAYLKPFRVAEVRNALATGGFDKLQVLTAEEMRPADTYTEVVQGTKYEVDVLQRAILVLVVEDADVDRAVELIQQAARTEHPGDGRILISSVEKVVSIDPSSPQSVGRRTPSAQPAPQPVRGRAP